MPFNPGIDGADGLIIGAIGGTIVLTTIERVTSDAASRGPTMTVVIGGVLVTVPLLILADYEPKIAVAFALLIFLGKFLLSQDVLKIAGNVLALKPGDVVLGAAAPKTLNGTTGSATTSGKLGKSLPLPSGQIGQVLAAASGMLGMPYSHNPDGTTTVDCSLFVQKAYAAAGIPIPRTTFDQAKAGIGVAYSDVQPGDLIFEKGLDPSGQWVNLGHVVMYIGQGKVIQAQRTGTNVMITPAPSSGSVQAVRRYVNQ